MENFTGIYYKAFKYELLAFNSIAFVLGILIMTYWCVWVCIALGLILEVFTRFLIIFFCIVKFLLDASFSLPLMLRGKNRQEKRHNKSCLFPFLCFYFTGDT